MSETAPSSSPFYRFFNAFLQERNIKWVLTAGLAILLGSSAMMVTSHWDTLGGSWKYAILLGYVAMIHLAGQWTYHHLALHKTGTALMALTTLLVPLSFVAWHLLVLRGAVEQAGVAMVVTMPLALGLLGANTLFSVLASRRIFRHFLRGPQPTFTASYLLLSLAGAVAPSVAELGTAAIWIASFGMWIVFCVGAAKVNRHVFWLVEQHNAPRVVGFLPVMLLGAQFLGLFAINFLPHVAVPWIGLGLVLFSIPVLLTADTVAVVFQQRTGDLVRPLPWSISLPIMIGTGCCGAGVAMAGQQLLAPPHLPFALVPAALLAAVVMGLVARRTGHAGFVWLMLAGVLIGYNFSPVFFREAARQVVDFGAAAVHEQKLPYAFYGLTYLPLIGGLMAASLTAAGRGSALFAAPLRRLAVGLSALLMLASFTHPDATLYPVFLVGGAMTVVFGLQNWLFGDRRIAVVAVATYLASAAGLAAFVRQVLQIPLPPSADLTCFAVATAALLAAGHWLDRRIAEIALPSSPDDGRLGAFGRAICQASSFAATVGAAVYWLVQFGLAATPDHAWAAAALIAALLAAQSLKWLSTGVSTLAYAFVAAAAMILAISLRIDSHVLVTIATLVLLAQWVLDYIFAARPQWRTARAFAVVNRFSSFGGLAALLAVVYLPALTLEAALPRTSTGFSRVCALFVTAWAFDAARRCRVSALTVGGCLATVALASATFVTVFDGSAPEWLPALWAALALLALPVCELLRDQLQSALSEQQDDRAESLRAVYAPLAAMTRFALGATAFACLAWPTWPIRAAGVIGTFGLLTLGWLRKDRRTMAMSAAVGNWHAMLAVAMLCCGDLAHGWHELFDDGIVVWLPVALSAAVSLLFWQNRRWQDEAELDRNVAGGQRLLLRVLAVLGLAFSLVLHDLSVVQLFVAGATFALLALSECRAAVRTNDEYRVWTAEAIAAAAIGFFAWFHVISFGRGIAMFALLISGFALYAISRAVESRAHLKVFARPLSVSGLALPAAAAGVAACRHLFYAHQGLDPAWFGMNSLAMFFAAAFYFWQGLEARGVSRNRHCGFLVLSAVIVNAAMALLWIDLSWSDPQLFMVPIGASVLLLVEMLRQEIPRQLHDPLRYAGALVVLVSPTFDILGGSWLHLLTLMLLSVAVLLVAIGIRVRVLMYTGLGFLIADMIAMVVRGSVDHPDLLWLAGIACGVAVVTLAAICENNREKLLQRMRAMAAELETWN